MDVDTKDARGARDRVEAEAVRLGSEEESIRRDRAAQLFDEIDTLNAERLALLPSLSPEKRGAVTGFASAGWDQAASEVRQLTLILRYHRYIIGAWLLGLRHPGRALGAALAGSAAEVFEWLLALGVFVWWRRRSTALLRMMHGRAVDEDRRADSPRPVPPVARSTSSCTCIAPSSGLRSSSFCSGCSRPRRSRSSRCASSRC